MSSIIQIAGTSGSGKSHLMRSFLDLLETKKLVKPVVQTGRASPVGYEARGIFIPGSYVTPTGGCDTIKDISQVFSIVREHYDTGNNVVFEGLFCMNQTRAPQLAAQVGKDYHVLQLTTPLAVCMESINTRRAERGAGKLVNKKNTEDNYRRAVNFCATMREAGARVHKVSREEGLSKIIELLGLKV